MSKLIGVRLTDDEHEYLMKQPGKTGAEKMRSLLHQKTISDEIAERVSSRLESQFSERLTNIESTMSEIHEQHAEVRRAFNAVIERLNKIIQRLQGDKEK